MTDVKVWAGLASALLLASCGGDDGGGAETDPGSTSVATGTGSPSGATGTTATGAGSQTTAPTTSPATTEPTDSTDPSSGPGDESTTTDTSGCGTECQSDEDAIAVAVGYGTRRVRSADGVSWDNFVEIDPNGGDDNNLLRGVSYGNGLFMAVGGAGEGLSMVSGDGVQWRNEVRSHRAFISDTVWFAESFVGAGGNGYRLRSTDSGANWTETGPYYAGHFRDIVSIGDVAVAVGHTYGDQTVGLWSTTTDGVTWSAEQTGGGSFRNAAAGGSVVVAVGNEGRVASSTDGTTWTDADLGLDNTRGVFFGAGTFYVATNASYWTSSNGEDWTQESAQGPSISAELHGAFLAPSWPAAVQRAETLGEWETVFQVEGAGLSDIASGVPEAAL